jgi:hypothetical protein
VQVWRQNRVRIPSEPVADLRPRGHHPVVSVDEPSRPGPDQAARPVAVTRADDWRAVIQVLGFAAATALLIWLLAR